MFSQKGAPETHFNYQGMLTYVGRQLVASYLILSERWLAASRAGRVFLALVCLAISTCFTYRFL